MATGMFSRKAFWNAFSGHARHTATAARHLIAMLEDVEQQGALAETIKRLEERGCEIARQTIDALEHMIITPLDRDVSYRLLCELKCMQQMLRTASDRVAFYHFEQVRPEAVELAQILASSADKVLEAINMLTLASNQTPLAEVCRAIGADKHRAERVLRSASAGLFRELNDPIEIVKWRDILSALDSATCRADGVAHIIEGIVIDRV